MAALLWHLIEVMHMVRDDLTGKRFGKLVVLKELGYRRAFCKCDCGNVKEVNKSHLLSGDIISCGCKMRKNAIEARAPKLYKGTDINKISTATATSRSSTDIRGVSYSTRRGKYRANIGFRGQKFELGYFDTLEEAAKARKAAEERLYKPLIEEWRDSNERKQEKGK